ncbi:MAG: carboxypeptidase-like regulatory domain-containing protein [Bacteroides cellulosilyticus]
MKKQRFFEELRLKVCVTLAVCMALLLNAPFLGAQNSTIKVKGVVNDAMGPVIGASIVEKGNTGNGTITDIDGNFSLNVSSNSTLIVSFVGYKAQEIPVAGKTFFTIDLKEDNEMLEEVVVVGFATQKKVNLTGSVGTATAKDIEARPVANAVQALRESFRGLTLAIVATVVS